MALYYHFPHIQTLDDVLPHIDEACFRVVDKDGLTFVNYLMMSKETFPEFDYSYVGWDQWDNHAQDQWNHRAAIRRECRGITFDTATRKIVSRPYHKFFNAGERDDVAFHMIDVSRPHFILEKLDGSMIRPLPTPHGIRWGTKMGLTDVAMLAEEYVAGEPQYTEFAAACMEEGWTPIFEFCSRRARIVVDYPEEMLILTAIRNNVTGEYKTTREVLIESARWGIDMVERDLGIIDVASYVSHVKQKEGTEGVVIRFEDGHMVKVKNDWYVRIHRAKDMMRSEMRLLDLVFNEELDDLLPALDAADRKRIEYYLDSYYVALADLVGKIETTYSLVRQRFETKKDFAVSEFAKVMVPAMRSVMFSLWDGKFGCPADAATSVVRSSMTSETKFALMKETFALHTQWDAYWNPVEEAA